MNQIISITCLNLLLSTKAVKQYTATFTAANNGIEGTVTVDNGHVIINIDLSDPDLMNGTFPQPAGDSDVSFADCTNGGLEYHIHKEWTYGVSDEDDRFGGIECGSTYTGGHWDVAHACGPASGSSFCSNCVTTSEYSPNYDANPFSTEVGDWSGKYGNIELDADNKLIRTDSSFWEVLPEDMAFFSSSVVFHCNAGARAFCAPLVMSDIDASATVPSQDGGDVAAYFSTLSEDSMIMLASDGTITVNIDATSADITDACTEFEYSIFNAGTLTEAGSGDECNGIGLQYDPTNQCVPWSDSEYCANDCGFYDCTPSVTRWSCAPGDLSGKAGELLNTSAVYSKTVDGPNTLIPPTDSLLEKVIAIHCPYYDSSELKFLACAPIEAVGATPSPTEDSSSQLSMVSSFILAFISVLINL